MKEFNMIRAESSLQEAFLQTNKLSNFSMPPWWEIYFLNNVLYWTLFSAIFVFTCGQAIKVITAKKKENSAIPCLIAVLFFFVFSLIASLSISFSFPNVFLNPHKKSKIESFKFATSLSNHIDELIIRENQLSSHNFMNDRPTTILDSYNGPFGMILSESELNKLFSNYLTANQAITPYSSNRIVRVLEDIETILLRSPWSYVGDAVFEITEKNPKSATIIKFGKTKETCYILKELCNDLTTEINKEIGKPFTFADFMDLSFSTFYPFKKNTGQLELQFNAKELRYGENISPYQDINKLISQIESNAIAVYLLLPRTGKIRNDLCELEGFDVRIKNDGSIKYKDKFIVLLLRKEIFNSEFSKKYNNPNPLLNIKLFETGAVIKDSKGDQNIFAGWIVNPPSNPITKDRGIWVSLWNE